MASAMLRAFAFGLTAAAATAAAAQPAAISGSRNGLSWQAQSLIVGQTSTSTLADGGDPRFFAQMPQYSGVVALQISYGSGTFLCSGTLLPDRVSVLTAGHCVSSGAGTTNPQVTAYFYGGPDPDTFVPGNPLATGIAVSQFYVNPGYTGQVVDQNDIAVLRLAEAAPAFATSYGIYTGTDLTGRRFNGAGYGAVSTVGGAAGINQEGGRLRQGDNRYEFRLGDPDFGGFFSQYDQMDPNCSPGENFFCGTADIGFSYLSDFDSGQAANDTSGLLAAGLFGLDGAKYDDLGVGALEFTIASGDSGSPQFVDGLISSVASYGLTFGTEYGDLDELFNSTWGEFGGYVPTNIHADFIFAAMVPEPATWALGVIGFGLIGGALRRRPQAGVRAAA